jgi:[acyl-carrier-protein] S-malonyltransferase
MELNNTGNRKLALIFPGQGSQYVGMGHEIYQASAAARRIFHEAEEMLSIPLRRICFEGPEEVLRDTINAQPAILTVSIATLAALRERLEEIGSQLAPSYTAGHSLGEYSALVAAGALDFREGVLLVRERGRLMKESGEYSPGGMAAVIGMDSSALEQVCYRVKDQGIVCPANYNSPGQTVISGDLAALSAAMQLAVAEGARRAVRLAVSIAAHSPLMQRAAEQFAEALARFSLADATVPIISNVTAQAISTADDIRAELAVQICRSVRWAQSVTAMVEGGATTFVEVGPGNVLSGLVKRVYPGADVYGVDDLESLRSFPSGSR